jgi:hypothetical protein
MIEDKCFHVWVRLTPATGVQLSSKFNCSKCETIMTAPEVFQLESLENQSETLKHLKGFQSQMAILALVISFIALLVAIYYR